MSLKKCFMIFENKKKKLKKKIDTLRYNFFHFWEVNIKTRFFREKRKFKYHECRINRTKIFDFLVDVNDIDFLEYDYKVQETLMKKIYMKLNVIEKDIMKKRNYFNLLVKKKE